MKLAEAKQRAIDTELRSFRDRRARDVLPAVVALLGSGVLLLSTVADPGEWAKGDFFKPGHALHDTLGLAGAVLLIRGALAVLTLLSLAWLVRVIRDLTWGLAAKRADIAAGMRTFDPPDQR